LKYPGLSLNHFILNAIIPATIEMVKLRVMASVPNAIRFNTEQKTKANAVEIRHILASLCVEKETNITTSNDINRPTTPKLTTAEPVIHPDCQR